MFSFIGAALVTDLLSLACLGRLPPGRAPLLLHVNPPFLICFYVCFSLYAGLQASYTRCLAGDMECTLELYQCHDPTVAAYARPPTDWMPWCRRRCLWGVLYCARCRQQAMLCARSTAHQPGSGQPVFASSSVACRDPSMLLQGNADSMHHCATGPPQHYLPSSLVP